MKTDISRKVINTEKSTPILLDWKLMDLAAKKTSELYFEKFPMPENKNSDEFSRQDEFSDKNRYKIYKKLVYQKQKAEIIYGLLGFE